MDLFKGAKSLFAGDGKNTSINNNNSNNNNNDSSSSNGFNILKFLDKNNDGKITEEDFVLLVEQAGLGMIGKAIVKKVFQSFDTNKNGCLEQSEVLGAFEKVKDLFNSIHNVGVSNHNNNNASKQ